MRTFLPDTQAMIENSINRISSGIASAADADIKVHYEKRYPPLVNSHKEMEFAARVAREIVGDENVDTNLPPTMGSEDFSFSDG